MRSIGLLGGTSWPSTIDYYTTLNRMVADRLGGYHSARLSISSIDYHDIKSSYTTNWSNVAPLLKVEIERALMSQPNIFLIACNTLHKALDELNFEFGSVKLIHIVDETGYEAERQGYRKLLLLGTKFTMEDGFYANKLRQKFHLIVDTPSAEDRVTIQTIQTALAAGESPELYEAQFKKILDGYPGYDAVVPACTELPLIVTPKITPLPILNPTYLQCRAAVEAALS